MNYRELNEDMRGMNTKKSILFWWKHLGFIKDRINDLKSFRNCIDKHIKVEEEVKSDFIILKLNKFNWKYPLILFFHNKECVSISGF